MSTSQSSGDGSIPGGREADRVTEERRRQCPLQHVGDVSNEVGALVGEEQVEATPPVVVPGGRVVEPEDVGTRPESPGRVAQVGESAIEDGQYLVLIEAARQVCAPERRSIHGP